MVEKLVFALEADCHEGQLHSVVKLCAKVFQILQESSKQDLGN